MGSITSLLVHSTQMMFRNRESNFKLCNSGQEIQVNWVNMDSSYCVWTLYHRKADKNSTEVSIILNTTKQKERKEQKINMPDIADTEEDEKENNIRCSFYSGTGSCKSLIGSWEYGCMMNKTAMGRYYLWISYCILCGN